MKKIIEEIKTFDKIIRRIKYVTVLALLAVAWILFIVSYPGMPDWTFLFTAVLGLLVCVLHYYRDSNDNVVHTRAYKEGYTAGLNNIPEVDNPYDWNGMQSEDWYTGWHNGKSKGKGSDG